MDNTNTSLTDAEIASLLDKELDPDIRQALLTRLSGDPDAQRTLALAAAETDLSRTLPKGTLEELMRIVQGR